MADNIPESWLALLGGHDASGWLAAFVESPKKAVNDLLWDAFYFGPLNLTERSQLLAGWLERLDSYEQFAQRLDAELTAWVEENWGRFDHNAALLSSAWSCLCSIVEFSSKLPEDSRLKECARALYARFAERQWFLGSFSSAPAADPLGLYLTVIAEFQGDDRSLAPFWHNMCDLPDGVPFYHARYAMLGLRRLKAADPSENGTLRAEIVLGLLQLARAFNRLVEERGLEDHIARATFRRVAARTAAAYPKSPRWRDHGLRDALELPERAQRWLLESVPPLAEAMRQAKSKTKQPHQHQRPRRSIVPDPNWSKRSRELAARLKKGDLKCLSDVKLLLDEERRYAEATGETYDIVRSLRNLATRVLHFNSDLALLWAEEARKWEPHDDYSWSTMMKVLLYRNNLNEALRFAWVASKRFPESSAIRNSLAEMLKIARRYEETEAIYRQNIELFPKDVIARTGLAEVLKAVRRYDEAVAVYRQTIKDFPEDIIARTALADTLRRSGFMKEAEAEYRHMVKSGQADSATFTGLAYLVLRKGEAGHAEASELVEEALRLDPRSQEARKLKQQLAPDKKIDVEELTKEWEKAADELFGVNQLAEHSKEAGGGATREVTPIEAEDQRPAVTVSEPQTEPRVHQEARSDEAYKADDEASSDEPHKEEEAKVEDDVAALPKAEYRQPPGRMTKTLKPKKPESPLPEKALNDEAEVKAEEATVIEAKDQRPAVTVSEPQTEPRAHEVTEARDETVRDEAVRDEASAISEVESQQTNDRQAVPAEAEPEAPGTVETTHKHLATSGTLEVAALVAEAYFYRTWARGVEDREARKRRRKAAELLDRAEQLLPQDPQILAERIALSMDEGDKSATYGTLTAQLGSRSSAVSLLVLKARLDREQAQKESRRLSEAALDELCESPQRLRNLNSTLTPLFYFERGLAALSLLDGSVRREIIAEAFSKFRRALAQRASSEKQETPGRRRAIEVSNFHTWLQRQVNTRVFAGLAKSEEIEVRADDVLILEDTWKRRPVTFEEVEDVLSDRFTFRTI